jgi:hypothetical protein
VLTVSGGDRKSPKKPTVEVKGDRFVFPALKSDEHPVVLQLRADAIAKPVTARFTYDAATCGACKNPERLCKCRSEKREQRPAQRSRDIAGWNHCGK